MKSGKTTSTALLSLALLSMLLVLWPLTIASTSTGSEIHVWYFANEGPITGGGPLVWSDSENDYRIIKVLGMEVKGILVPPATYYVNPTGSGFATSAWGSVVAEIQAAFETWDAEVDPELFSSAVGPVATIPSTTKPVDGTDNGYNEVVWKDLGPGIVATTRLDFSIIGGLLYIVEFDTIFNTDYDWSIAPTTGKYDVGNVATHEVGHVVGLDDLKQAYTIYLTMYFAASTNDDSKESLGEGDKLGAEAIY